MYPYDELKAAMETIQPQIVENTRTNALTPGKMSTFGTNIFVFTAETLAGVLAERRKNQ